MHNNEIVYAMGGNCAYLDCDFPVLTIDNQYPITTHTMTTSLLKEKLPGHQITRIFCGLQKSLRRAWQVSAKNSYLNLSFNEQIDGMFEFIKYNQGYYSRWPVDEDADVIVDIETGTSDFCQVMRKELDIVNPDFDFVWNVYQTHGSDAPIMDVINEYKK